MNYSNLTDNLVALHIESNGINNTNYDIITNLLLYKQLHPPIFDHRIIKSTSCIGDKISKVEYVKYNVQGKGWIIERLIYDLNNKPWVSYIYISEKTRKRNRESYILRMKKYHKYKKNK